MRPVDCVIATLDILPDVFVTSTCERVYESISGIPARKDQVPRLLKSLSRYGIVKPIVGFRDHMERVWLINREDDMYDCCIECECE